MVDVVPVWLVIRICCLITIVNHQVKKVIPARFTIDKITPLGSEPNYVVSKENC